MRFRLAGGVVTADRCAWAGGADGPRRLAGQGDAPPGAAVALGPDDADDAQARRAVAELERLTAAAGAAAAGAGVDLGAGFRSARLDGARGDQRDAVLAALRAVGAERLGERGAVLVALFGPAATRRVGAAAARAVTEERWAALDLAAAASDVLGPEQLEGILALQAPPAVDVVGGGPASALAAQLRQVLEPVPRPRRPGLLVSLWEAVLALHAARDRTRRLRATQGRQSRLAELRARRGHDADEEILEQLRYYVARPSLADAARWMPPGHFWHIALDRLLNDALAATVLLRTVVAVSDHGVEEGLARVEPQLAAVVGTMTEYEASTSARRIPGLTGLPARPGSFVRDIHAKLARGKGHGPKFEAYVAQHLAHARDYALVVLEEVQRLIEDPQMSDKVLRDWAGNGLRRWRSAAGYTAVRPPAAWESGPTWFSENLDRTATLADRLRTAPDADPAGVEERGDLLWCADLADALAQVYGHDAATVDRVRGPRWLQPDPPPAPPEPLAPRLDSVAVAVSGAAQLAALGGTPPKGVRDWAGLVAGLRDGVDVAGALSGEFAVPAPLDAVDRTVVPGTGARVRLARTARDLAEWSDYMGNCIAGGYYTDAAVAGRCGLAGLYDEHGRLLVNIELRPSRGGHGWRIEELKARFNADPEPELEQRLRAWAGTLPGTAVDADDQPVPEDTWPAPTARRRSAPRLPDAAGPALADQARRARDEPEARRALAVWAALADAEPDAALTRLRRHGADSLAHVCRTALREDTVTPGALWHATSVRPLTAAVAALEPELRERFGQLGLLASGEPLPRSLRRLVRLPAVAPAYAMDVAARRTRAALGRLLYGDDAELARAVARRSTVPLLCALVVAVTCRPPRTALVPVVEPHQTAVPGFPATSLADEDGPWRRAFPDAAELGCDPGEFWDRISADGLRVPAAWLSAGGWTALWARAQQGRP